MKNIKAIFIEAGHGLSPSGTIDNGAAANGTSERAEVVKIALDVLRNMLKNSVFHNIEVIPIGVHENIGLVAKINKINQKCEQLGYNSSNALLVSIHLNSASPSAVGTEAWYYGNDEESKRFGECIAQEISKQANTPERPSRSEYTNRHKRLGIIHDTKPLACLIECDFLTNTEAANKLKDDNANDVYAKGIVMGIMNYIGVENPVVENSVNENTPSEWAKDAIAWCKENNIALDFSSPGKFIASSEAEIMLFRSGLLTKLSGNGVTKEQLATIIYRIKKS